MKDRLIFFLSQYIGPLIVGFLARTLRVQRVGVESLETMEKQGSFLYALFHGRMFVPIWVHRGSGITALVSQSRDGEAVTRLVMGFGYRAVRGSSHRGAKEALRGMVNCLRDGHNAVVMVDGPRGPNEEPKIGTIAIARMAGVPILPVMGASFPCWEFGSWDRFQLPKPFAKAVMVYGDPMTIPADAKGEVLEDYRLDLQKRLKSLREKADEIVRGR